MSSIIEDTNSIDSSFSQEPRRPHRLKSQKVKEQNMQIEKNILNRKKSKNSVEKDVRKVNNLLNIRSSKSVVFKLEGGVSNHGNKFNEELIPEIIDTSYNFSLNYQLKETAINVFKSGIDKDKTKIKFFSNYLYQLSPFNKIFSKIRKSKNLIDIYNIQRILCSLSTELKYEYLDANKIIYKHGDTPDKYYILLKGEVDIIVPNEIEVMMSEFEYYNYILRLYKYQEISLLKKVLNKNYNIYPLNKQLFEDWIHTAYNTLRHLEKESELNKISRRRKKVHRYIPSYDNAEELFNRLEKEKKLNLLMMNKNVIILLGKIRMRNERAREAAKNRGMTARKKDDNKNNKKNKKNKSQNKDKNNYHIPKPSIGYSKLDGQLKKIFMNEEQIEVIEKCSTEIYQLVEILSKEFNMRKYLNELNRCNSQKYLYRVEPYFFDEDTNKKLDSKLFILSRNNNDTNLNKGNHNETESNIDTNDIKYKLQNLFQKKSKNKTKKKNELFNNRKKTIVYHYVVVNTICSGETFGEISNEPIKKDDAHSNQRIATIITRENSHLASLKKYLYNKILKEIHENNVHQQLTFLFSLDIFKNCNKNNFMKNYISFFIKKSFRVNEIVFKQDEDLGEDRSIFFIVDGSFSSYCNASVNDIETLFNNLHYEGLIPEDDAHEDNLFNKENHYFCEFKKKKIIFNLLYFTNNDIIGFNDALYNGKYIYTVKCQSSIATVYEIKLKFFNLILNSEAKLYESVNNYEMVKRNLMIKFFLNGFKHKNNFYKFISFNGDENNKEDKNIIHKNYFGKNPFRDSKDDSNVNKRNKTDLKLSNTIQNKIKDNYLTLISRNNRIASPDIKLSETFSSNLLNHNNRNSFVFLNQQNKMLNKNKSKSNIKKTILLNSINANFRTETANSKHKKIYLKTETETSNESKVKKKFEKMSINKENTFFNQNELNNKDKEIENNNEDLKIEEYNNKKKIVIPPIITNQINKNIHLNANNKNLYSSLFNSSPENNNNDNSKINLFEKKFNKKTKNELSFRSSNLDNSTKINSMKSEIKTMNKFIKYLGDAEDDIPLKNSDVTKNEEMQLKCYLKGIPEFFHKDNCKKNIFFGMNKKSLFQNNILFTEFK